MVKQTRTLPLHLRRRDRGPFVNRLDIRLLTGFAAVAVAGLTIAEFVVKATMGIRPSLDDATALTDFITRTANSTLVVILIDSLLMGALIIFFACFRQLTIRARQDLNWVADIAFSAGLIFVAVTLVGDSMDAGTALDTVHSVADPSAIRALTEGHMLMFGSIGCVLTALVTATFGYTSFASKAVPRWTAIIAYTVAVLNIAALPTIFGGTDPHSLISAGGVGVAAFAIFPFLVWVVAVGIVTLNTRHRRQLLIAAVLGRQTRRR